MGMMVKIELIDISLKKREIDTAVDTGTGERIRIGSYTVPAEAGDTQGLAFEYGNCVGR
jgi:hypothetical protein